MREYGSNINLPSLDNLFSSEQERQDAKLEKIQILPLTELHPFRNHPFQVRDDDEMDKMVDSVKEYGVMTPAIVRPRQDGGYEIVAGHRRCHASQRAGVETMPCIVRDMDDDTAIILMVDSNCQREHILPSEKAKAYEMKLAAIKRQGQRRDLTSGQVVQKLSVQEVADGSGEGYKTVQRFIRLNKLTPELKYEPARHISKTLNEIDSMGQKTITGKMAISKEDYSELTSLAKEGITSRAEINKLEQSANYYRQKYFDSANALERMKTKYNELKEKCRPFLEALEHFPEVAKLFTEKVKQLFSFKEAQERAEKEAREKERQERIKARRNKRGMER